MAKFRYRATTEKGRTVSGIMEAGSESELYAKLREQQLFMVSAEIDDPRSKTKKIKAKELGEFCRQVGTLLGSGVSLVRALGIISQDEMLKAKHRIVYERLLQSIRQGTPLSDAMEEQGAAFPPLMVNMFRSAEASGDLDRVAMRMAKHYEKEHRMNAKVKNAMTYPIILLVLIVAVVLVLFTFVVPQFSAMYADMDSELPGITQFILGVSDFVIGYWWAIIFAVIVLGILLRVAFQLPKVKYQKSKMYLGVPVFGKLLKVVYTARFARTLSSLYSSGLPIVSSLQIAASTIGNPYIQGQFDEVIASVRQGGNLSDALSRVDGFTKKLSASIMIGEETGSLDSMLDSTAEELDYESEMAIARMLTFIEPIMIVLMAIVVGVVIISVIMPMFGSYEAIGGGA